MKRRYTVLRASKAGYPFWEGWLIFDRDENLHLGTNGPLDHERACFGSRTLAQIKADELEHDDKLRELIRIAESSGWRTDRGGGQHVKFFTPEGRYVTSCTTTKTCGKSYYEVRAKLRRAGLVC